MFLASYNFGLPKVSVEAPGFEGFNLREPVNFDAAEQAEGFVGRSRYDDEDIWGTQVFPRFLEGTGLESGLSQLSVWRDLESLMAFTYNGVHANALKHGHNWNRERSWPSVVLWWVSRDVLPSWKQAVERFEHLHDRGPSEFAFNFKTPFNPEGHPASINRDQVKAIAARNGQKQHAQLAQVQKMKI